jgi:hypothetical protein
MSLGLRETGLLACVSLTLKHRLWHLEVSWWLLPSKIRKKV